MVDWYLDFSKESYTTLKNVISSFKIFCQKKGQLKTEFLRQKIQVYFSEIWAFLAQGADAKNSEKYNKKSVWASLSNSCLTLSAIRNHHVFIELSDKI